MITPSTIGPIASASLAMLDERYAVVGFSRLRPTKLRENLRWIKHRFGARATPGNLPARIVLFDLEREAIEWEFNIENHGMNAVFSIHVWHGAKAAQLP